MISPSSYSPRYPLCGLPYHLSWPKDTSTWGSVCSNTVLAEQWRTCRSFNVGRNEIWIEEELKITERFLILVLHPSSDKPSADQSWGWKLILKTTIALEIVDGPDPWGGYLIMHVQDHWTQLKPPQAYGRTLQCFSSPLIWRGLLYIKFGVPTKSDLLSAKLLHKTGAYVPSQLKDPNCAVN